MANPTFDPSKKYGYLRGDTPGMPAAQYLQDGHYYTAQLRYIGSRPGAVMAAAEPAAVEEPVPAPPAEVEQSVPPPPLEVAEIAESEAVPPPPE